MEERGPIQEVQTSRQVFRLIGITIAGPEDISGLGVREVFPTEEGEVAGVKFYALVIKGVNVITIGRVFNADKLLRRTSTVDIVVSKNGDGTWFTELYVDAGVSYESSPIN